MSSRLDKAADDQFRDKIAAAEKEIAELEKKYGEMAADATLAAASMAPPPAGTIADVVSLGKSLLTGDWGGALLDTVGFIPLFGDAAKAAGKGTKLVKMIDVLKTAITAAKANLARLKDSLIAARKAHATKYWEEIVAKGRKAYDEALAKCTTVQCADDLPISLKGEHYKKTPLNGGDWKNGTRGDGDWTPKPGSPLAKRLESFSLDPKLNPSGKKLDSIPYRNGFPQFDDLVVPTGKGPAQVEIPQTGKSLGPDGDFAAADEALKASTGKTKAMLEDELGTTLTWHHKEDGVTMQLVPEKLHGAGNQAGHVGGSSLVQNPEF